MGREQRSNVLQHIRQLAAARGSSSLPDRQMLEHFVIHRDDAAFASLVERHGPMVLSVCQRVLRNTHDAEDACQATFLVLARKAASIRQAASLASWLHGVAYRLATKLKADLARRHAPQRPLVDQPHADGVEDLTWREARVILDQELNCLPEKYRAPLVLCYLEGQARDEAAQQLGWTLGTLRGRLERGRERLRARLTRRGLAFSAAFLATLLSQSGTSAAVPPLLVVATAKAATQLARREGGDGRSNIHQGRCFDRRRTGGHVRREAESRGGGSPGRRCPWGRHRWLGVSRTGPRAA